MAALGAFVGFITTLHIVLGVWIFVPKMDGLAFVCTKFQLLDVSPECKCIEVLLN